RCPFVIREVQSGPDGSLMEPFLIAAGPQSVQGVSLLTMESREFASCLTGERILSHPEDGHVSVEADAKFVYFLTLRDNQLLMKRANLATGQVSSFPLRDKQVVGPFRVGPHVCAYSKRTLYIMEEAGVREFALPPNFVAWTAAAEGRGLQAQSGRLPHLVRDGAVYVPGMELQTPGFLLIDLASRSPQPAFIPLRQQATFTQDREGRPILAEDKQIVRLDQTGRTTLKQDDQIAGRRPPYVFGNLMAAFARRGGGEFLRFYTGSNVHDYPLAMLEHFVEPVGMFLLGSSVMITYVDEELQLGVAIWDF
ncbi:MAG: hypothetical protein NT154_04985, partial [Verrucomicrobia bacterium]|nr:hypothetical protein [Verrucomicrobiota bacterium]